MTENIKADIRNNVKYLNPVPLGTLYFGFSLVLWSSERINSPNILVIAIFFSLISLAFFVSVFFRRVLRELSKWEKRLVFLTFIVSFISFTSGWLQAFMKTPENIQIWIAYFGFAWIIVFLLTLIKDSIKQPTHKKSRILPFIRFISPYVPYLMIVAFIVIAVVKFCNHDLCSGLYLIFIAGLSLSVARDWLKVQGGLFEYTD